MYMLLKKFNAIGYTHNYFYTIIFTDNANNYINDVKIIIEKIIRLLLHKTSKRV